jgi:predicted DNA binding CopG/RHH family protein
MGKAKTPTKTIRVSDSLWAEVKKKAAAEKVTVTSVILSALNKYVGKE